VDHFCGAGTAVPKLSVLCQQRQVTLAEPPCLRRNDHCDAKWRREDKGWALTETDVRYGSRMTARYQSEATDPATPQQAVAGHS
jgi:hypothetical protein